VQGCLFIIVSMTRNVWSHIYYAVRAAGSMTVPVYPSSSLSQVRWMVEDSGAVLAITESQDHTELVQHLLVDDSGNPSLAGSTSQLRRILEINSSAIDTLKFEGRSLSDDAVHERISATS